MAKTKKPANPDVPKKPRVSQFERLTATAEEQLEKLLVRRDKLAAKLAKITAIEEKIAKLDKAINFYQKLLAE